MRGLAAGEQSTGLYPALQLFTRSGEFLADPVSGSFTIDDISDPETDPQQKVATTNLDLNDYPTGHKLGTGRFVIPTGDTSSWKVGTHRVVYSYVMETGGRTYKQIIPFEILDAGLYPTGQSYVGYVQSRTLLEDGAFGLPVKKLHKYIREASIQLEGYTERFFEPRYITARVDGHEQGVLFLQEAIVALEKVEIVERQSDGTEDAELLDNTLYRVYNRHLNGLLNPDDRYNPRLSVVDQWHLPGVHWELWAFGRQNVRIYGVFGFTDPDPEPGEIMIGHTPDELERICATLVGRIIEDPFYESISTHKPGMVRAYRTRDQQIQFYGASGNVNHSGGLTGDPLLDQKLQRFVKPARLRYTERENYRGPT